MRRRSLTRSNLVHPDRIEELEVVEVPARPGFRLAGFEGFDEAVEALIICCVTAQFWCCERVFYGLLVLPMEPYRESQPLVVAAADNE